MTTPDGEIIRRSLEQPAAFAELYDRHERVVFRYAARRLGAYEADDIASETFLVAFTRRRDFTGSESARPWLLGIATTLMRHHARKEAKPGGACSRRTWRAPISTRLTPPTRVSMRSA